MAVLFLRLSELSTFEASVYAQEKFMGLSRQPVSKAAVKINEVSIFFIFYKQAQSLSLEKNSASLI
jgi:hypothetical protein